MSVTTLCAQPQSRFGPHKLVLTFSLNFLPSPVLRTSQIELVHGTCLEAFGNLAPLVLIPLHLCRVYCRHC